MKEKENIKKELEELSPFLAKNLKEESGFKVPQNYFHNLQLDIMQQIAEEEEQAKNISKQKEITVLGKIGVFMRQYLFQPKYAFALASVLVLLVTTTVILQQSTTDCTDPLCDLTSEEINQYVEDNIEDFSLELILETATIDEEAVDVFEGLENEDLEEYIDENLELEDLLEEEMM